MDVKAPTFPESISEGELTKWYKSVGEYVERDDVLADIETEKTTMEIPAPLDGLLVEVHKQEGDLVESEELLARLDESAARPVPEAAEARTNRRGERRRDHRRKKGCAFGKEACG